ncbi:MAG: polysaccharide deacetylase family protein [Bacteroidales bacterium]
MILFKTPRFIRKIYNKAIICFPNKPGSLFFTFDDGPDPEVTPKVLDVLKRYQAKATFFCLGFQVEQYPGIVDRIRSEGHAIGNHGFVHLNGLKTNSRHYIKDVEKAESTIKSHLFRPPHGLMRPAQYKNLSKQYTIILWDVMVYDFNQMISIQKTLTRVKKHITGGSIVVFHDAKHAHPKVLQVLEELLEYYSGLNYKFEAIS